MTEEEQANYLVRYFIICLASGLVERVYWWQLVAPGYGLIDSRDKPWRKRPSYFALATMVRLLEGSRFIEKMDNARAEIFLFGKGEEEFAVCWTKKGTADYRYIRSPRRVLGRDGDEKKIGSEPMRMGEAPQYVMFG